eukprot:9492210-Pyramimonas_sp.AAC.2
MCAYIQWDIVGIEYQGSAWAAPIGWAFGRVPRAGPVVWPISLSHRPDWATPMRRFFMHGQGPRGQCARGPINARTQRLDSN